MIVVDASVVVEMLLRTPRSNALAARLFRPGESLNAPHLIDVEVAHAMRRLAILGKLDADRGRDALIDLVDMPIRRFAHDWLISAAWTLRSNVTAYDAMYVALADALDATLITQDHRLAAAVGQIVKVEHLD